MVEENIENVTQSPIEIELKWKTYKLGAIGFIDFGDFAQYVKGQKIKLTDNIKDVIIRMKTIDKIMNDPIDLDSEYKTINGMVYMAWKAIQKHQPEVTLEDINKLIDLDNFEKVTVIISNLGGKVNPTRKVKAKK